MSKVSAEVLTGILLGALYGFYNVHGNYSATALSAGLLGRSAQGIINGVLAAYSTVSQLGWIFAGLGCGVATAKAKR